jgi:hypothetical protein
MPTLTQIKRRKLLPPHEIQQIEDDVAALVRDDNEFDEKKGYTMIYSRKLDDNCEACLIVSVYGRDLARIKRTLTN